MQFFCSGGALRLSNLLIEKRLACALFRSFTRLKDLALFYYLDPSKLPNKTRSMAGGLVLTDVHYGSYIWVRGRAAFTMYIRISIKRSTGAQS